MNLIVQNQVRVWVDLMLLMQEILIYCKKCLRIRRWWVKPHLRDHEKEAFGAYHIIFQYFKLEDGEEFRKFVGMSLQQFSFIFRLVEPRLEKHNFRKPLPAELRLAATLNYLVHGGNIGNTALSFHIGRSTMYELVPEVCNVLYDVLKESYLQFPEDNNDWKNIASHFCNVWNMPNCVGSIDGKHLRIKAPGKSGSLFRNYKQFFSIVLMAMCDAFQRFIWANLGDFGSLNDASIFDQSDLGQALLTGALNFPEPTFLPRTNVRCPYFIIGDGGFPLNMYLMRPYARGVNFGNSEKIFNYRLSRARRIIECTFGTLTKKWKILETPLDWKLENIEVIIMAIICIHNFIITDELSMPANERRYEHNADCSNFNNDEENNVPDIGNNAVQQQIQIRDLLKNYFMSPEGSVPWQWEQVYGRYWL